MPEPHAEPPVVILSPDPEFSGTVAEHIGDELGLPCRVVNSKNELEQWLAHALAVVSTEKLEEAGGCPVLFAGQKPLKLQDLLDDIANIRHNHQHAEMALGEAYSLLWRQKQLWHVPSGKSVALTDKEARLLQYLAEARGQMVPRDQLLKQVWGFGEAVDTHTLETHIYRLRGKFRDLSGEDAMIAAMEGGYKLAIETPQK